MSNMIRLLPVMLLLSGCAVKGDYSCGVPDNGVRCQPMSQTADELADGTLVSLHTEPFPVVTDDNGNDYQGGSMGGDLEPESGSEVDASGPADQQGDAAEAADPVAPLPSIVSIQGATAILSPPREMRIWFDRFTDPEGDLHDESFVFIRIDNGHWVIDDKPVLY